MTSDVSVGSWLVRLHPHSCVAARNVLPKRGPGAELPWPRRSGSRRGDFAAIESLFGSLAALTSDVFANAASGEKVEVWGMLHRVWYSVRALACGAALLLGACQSDASEAELVSEPSEADDDEASSADGSVSDASAASSRDASAARDAGPRDASSGGDSGAAPPQDPPSATGGAKTLRAEGGKLLDTCGEPWFARGVEQLAAKTFAHDGTLAGLASELVKTGSNAVRLLPQQLGPADMEALLKAFATAKIVVYLSPGDRGWFKRSDIRAVLMKYEKGLIIDAFQEPDYNDVTRWQNDAKSAIKELRSAGYAAPLTVLANQYGRDLKSALKHGQDVLGADPMKNTILGWQAYWGKSGWYQKDSGMSLMQGIAECAKQNYPMQIGIDLYADPNDPMDYVEAMAAAQQHKVGWLWWNFWNEFDNLGNNASIDGTAARLTQAGAVVLKSDPNSIEKTAKKACFE